MLAGFWITFAWTFPGGSPCPVDGVDRSWAELVKGVLSSAEDRVHQAVVDGDHQAAKDVLQQRDRRLVELIDEFQNADPSTVSHADVSSILHACELAFRWQNGLEIGKQYLDGFPDSEELLMVLFRCQINLGMVDEAIRLLDRVEARFDDDSKVRFVHSMIARRLEAERRWKGALHHSVTAASRRVALARSNHNVATLAIEDFRRIAESAIALKIPDVGTARLTDLASQLDAFIAEFNSEEPDSSKDMREYVARKLRADIAYWIGGPDMEDQFESWIQYTLSSWRDERLPDRLGRRMVADIIGYLDEQGGMLTPGMLDQLDLLQLAIEARLELHPEHVPLKRLKRRCEDLIQREVFRVRPNRSRFGGI